jgi:nucleoside-diphosphate-sugar epimerase
MAEELIRTFGTLYDIPFTILRLFNFYGDDMPEDFFLSQLKNSLQRNEEFRMTKGEQIRDYLEVHEVINYVIGIVQTEMSINETVNICSGKGRKLSDLAMSEAKLQCKENLVKSAPFHIETMRCGKWWEIIKKLRAIINPNK